MARAHDWPARLAGVVADAEKAGWGWNGRTCLHLMIEAAGAVCDRDITAPVRDLIGGNMPRRRAALLRKLAALGGLEAAVAASAQRLGFPEIDPAIASAGDWGVADFAADAARPGMAEGVVRGPDLWFFRLPGRGLCRVPAPIAPVRRAWAVG